MGLKGHCQGGAHAVGPLRGHCQGGAHAVGPLRGSRRVPIGRWMSIMWNNLSREGRSRRVSSWSSSDRESRNRAKTAHCEGVRAAWLRGIRANPRYPFRALPVLRATVPSPRRSRCAQTGHVLPEWLRITYGYAKMVVPPPARDLYLPAQNLSHCPRLFRALSLICLLACFNGQMSTFENLLSSIYRTVQYVQMHRV